MDPRLLSAFNDEMKKLAGRRERREKSFASMSSTDRSERAALATMGANLGAYGATLALMKNPLQPGTGEEMKKYVLEMAKKMDATDLKHVSTPGSFSSGGWSPFSEFSGRRVNIPLHTGDAVIAHELGHAANAAIYQRTKGILKFMPHAYTASSTLSGAALLPTLAAAAESKDASYAPGVIQAILASPMIAEEAAASARAVSHLVKEHGLGKGALKSLPLIPAFATYATIASAPLLVTYLRRRAAARDAEAKASGKQKTSAKRDDDGLSFFERHPKKILGGAALAAGGGYMLLKGKKPATVKLPHAPKAPKPKPTLEEAQKLGLPGAKPLAKKVEPVEVKHFGPKKEVAVGKPPAQAKTPKPAKQTAEYEDKYDTSGSVLHGARDPNAPMTRHQPGRHKELKAKAHTLGMHPVRKDLTEEDADKILKAMGDFTKHSSIASRFSMAYSSR